VTMDKRFKVLIIGGYGTFGQRLVRLLEGHAALELVVAGRRLDQARAFADTRRNAGAVALLTPFEMDRNADPTATFSTVKPDLVADLSGPFQGYGDDCYRIAKAAIAQGIDYCDIADSRAFVCNFHALDTLAREHGAVAISGLSTCPTVTSAMVRAIPQHDFARVEKIEIGLAPSPRTHLGRAVIEAIASYAGKPVTRPGSDAKLAIADTRRFGLLAPGSWPLPHKLFHLVDVPDLEVLHHEHPHKPTVWFGVSTPPEIFQRALQAAARLVSWRVLPSLTPFAGLLHFTADRFRWGTPIGGMTVRLVGRAAADPTRTLTRSYCLIAGEDRGPFVPVSAVAALVERHLRGERYAPQARAGHGLMTVDDLAPVLSRVGIELRHAEEAGAAHDMPLYPALLQSAFNDLPTHVRELHSFAPGQTTTHWQGHARIARGTNLIANLVANIMGFPKPADRTPVTVELKREIDGARRRETWTRTFAGKKFLSIQDLGLSSRDRGTLIERFGPLGFRLAILTDSERLRLVPVSWRAFGIPMPKWAMPRVIASESVVDGRFQFDVDIALPFVGRVVHYRGFLEPATKAYLTSVPGQDQRDAVAAQKIGVTP
jgi:hypothetical protein